VLVTTSLHWVSPLYDVLSETQQRGDAISELGLLARRWRTAGPVRFGC
jgi:hypothetical protein